jgi:hypothetical protein
VRICGYGTGELSVAVTSILTNIKIQPLGTSAAASSGIMSSTIINVTFIHSIISTLSIRRRLTAQPQRIVRRCSPPIQLGLRLSVGWGVGVDILGGPPTNSDINGDNIAIGATADDTAGAAAGAAPYRQRARCHHRCWPRSGQKL